MLAPQELKQKLITRVDRLPEEDLREVIDFAGYLLARRVARPAPESGAALDLKLDPILEIVGSADVEPFAQQVDDLLYGESR